MQPLSLSRTCLKNSTRIAIIYKDRSYTFQEYHDLISRSAQWLKKAGIKKGDRVAILSENSLQVPLMMFGLFTLGAIAVPVNFRIPLQQMHSMLLSINCRKILLAGKFARKHPAHGFKYIQIEKLVSNPGRTAFIQTPIEWPLQQKATIIFTSGSTGLPKAALLTIGNHYYNAQGSNENIRLKPGNRWLLTLPLYHVGGVAVLFRALLAGATVVIPSDLKKIAGIISERNLTHISVVAAQLFRLLAQPETAEHLRRLKALLLGGGPAADSLVIKAVRRGIPVYLTYGLTEMASQVTTTRRKIKSKERSLFHCGKVLKYGRLKIDRHGEILVKGLTLFNGYVQKRRIYRTVDKNGWFHTGDTGRMTARGDLLVTGRKDNMFISGGENIHPEEIEKHLKNIAGIENALVVPVADKEFGQRPVAFIKQERGFKIDPERLQNYLQHNLTRFKIPRVFLPWPDEEPALKPERKKFNKYTYYLFHSFNSR
jgi:o-succinylbenzoate---CoA ligase